MKYVLAICVCLMIGCGEQPGHSVAEAAKEFEEMIDMDGQRQKSVLRHICARKGA